MPSGKHAQEAYQKPLLDYFVRLKFHKENSFVKDSCYNSSVSPFKLYDGNSCRMYTQGFGTLFILFLCSFLFAFSTILAAWIVSPKAPSPLKQTPYESGMTPFGEAHIKFDVKFYLYTLLFILFDIEAIFLFPWAVAFEKLGVAGLLEMFLFIAILFLGLLYAWRRKALEWQ